MACNENISNTCMDPIKSTCVDHEGTLGANTKITDECVNQYEVNEDLYAITDEVIEGLDISTLTSACITIPVDATVADVIILYEAKICELNTQITDLENIAYEDLDITTWGLTIPGCIADVCANPPTTLGVLVQAMMDNQCA